MWTVRPLNTVCLSACLIAITIFVPVLSAQTPITALPNAKDEIGWLLATCGGTTIPGKPQPLNIPLSVCLNENGANKIETGIFFDGMGGSSTCRFGIDKCPGTTRRQAFALISEEFGCLNGKKSGLYKANIQHLVNKQSIYGARVEANFVGGKLQGESRHFSPTKKFMCFRYHYKDGLLDGKAEKFFAKGGGRLIQDAYFKNGYLNGKRTTYSDSGSVKSFSTYEVPRV